MKKDTKKNKIVYVARSSLGEVLYVGQGAPNRHLHCASGVSHVYELNKMHFEGKKVHVEVVKEGLSQDEAVEEERKLIEELVPTFNKIEIGMKGSILYQQTLKNIREKISETQPLHRIRDQMKFIEDTIAYFGFKKVCRGILQRELTAIKLAGYSKLKLSAGETRDKSLMHIFQINSNKSVSIRSELIATK